MNIKNLLEDFMKLVASGNIEVYNEFSLQHELGIFLRANISGYKIQFERNTKFFKITRTIKHEIDIVIYNEFEKYAIELKYPLNGQYPEQMFSFIKDILFMEQMKQAGFSGTYTMTLVKDRNFYSGCKQDGIYAFFRGASPIHGVITKPTGKKNERVDVNGFYVIRWQQCNDMKFYVVEL